MTESPLLCLEPLEGMTVFLLPGMGSGVQGTPNTWIIHAGVGLHGGGGLQLSSPSPTNLRKTENLTNYQVNAWVNLCGSLTIVGSKKRTWAIWWFLHVVSKLFLSSLSKAPQTHTNTHTQTYAHSVCLWFLAIPIHQTAQLEESTSQKAEASETGKGVVA